MTQRRTRKGPKPQTFPEARLDSWPELELLSPRHALFVRAYLVHMNATAAYRSVYPRNRNPDVDGPALLGNPGVRLAVDAGVKLRGERYALTAENVLRELARLAFSDLGDCENPETKQLHRSLRDMPLAARRAVKKFKVRSKTYVEDDQEVSEETVEVELHPKDAAIDKAMKHLGLFPKEVVEIELKYSQLVALGKKLRDARRAAETSEASR